MTFVRVVECTCGGGGMRDWYNYQNLTFIVTLTQYVHTDQKPKVWIHRVHFLL